MIVYVVIVNDRHSEPQAVVFSTDVAAIAYARNQARELARYATDTIDETPIYDGWLYHASYAESSSLWVVPTIIDQPR